MRENKLPNQKPDFEAEINILTTEQGGRNTPPLNGIRWDFRYPEDDLEEGVYMIHPYFIDKDKNLIPGSEPLSRKLRALMFIISDESREYHRKRLSVGSKFYCVEGSKTVAIGLVTKLNGLI